MIYTTCRYAPIELFKGFNEEHKILEVKVKNFSCAENYVHPNLCSYAKAVIETVLKENIKEYLLKECKVAVNEGEFFGKEGAGFVRFNLACPRSSIKVVLEKLKEKFA